MTKKLASLTLLRCQKCNRPTTKEYRSSKNYGSELKWGNQHKYKGMELNPNQTNVLKRCKREKTDQEP